VYLGHCLSFLQNNMLPVIAAGLATWVLYKLLTSPDDSREVNFDLVCTGPQCAQTTQSIQQAFSTLVKRHRRVKIGKTTNPARRFQAQDYQRYGTMYVLYQASTDACVSHYETHFITRFRRQLRNQHPNSTGRPPQRRTHRHYLYAVVE
jgi:hypothetical protein